MASSSTSSIQKSFKYDVFLSFRGETRLSFVDHLFFSLEKRNNIYTYKDDVRMKKGKMITDDLDESIKDSKFYIIVLSKDYPSSPWCLNELVSIMKCHKETGHTAYPIFYDVKPSEVCDQKGEFGIAFAKLKNEMTFESYQKGAFGEVFAKFKKEKACTSNQKGAFGKVFAKLKKEKEKVFEEWKEKVLEEWKDALRAAVAVDGWELKKTADGHEAIFIQKIVELISLELCSTHFSIDKKLVGMDSRIEDVLSSLGTDCDDVRMIGIKGMGGGGKTTLARAIFDRISLQFEGKSFVDNVREVSNSPSSGLKSLQNQILSDVLNGQCMNISSVFDGKNMLKRMMGGRKVLLVLDDVDHIEQLEALAGEYSWFKPGSIIIITTRDEQVLVAHKVELIRNVKLLSDKEAMCLFNMYAFAGDITIQGYEKLSGVAVHYAAGLPLSIRLLGSLLCGKNKLEWIDAIERLKMIPLEGTRKVLELSYLSLEEDHKEIFLDVACIMKGWPLPAVIEVLKSRGFYPNFVLRVLEKKSLITVNENVGMHDHLEAMGKDIVRRLYPSEPNKHSRLWINEEIEDIFVNDLGTNATICIRPCTLTLDPETVMKGLRKMTNIRYLDLSLRTHLREYDDTNMYFPDALRYLCWKWYPFRSLPATFKANNLVVLRMPFSNIIQLWERGDQKVLNKLQVLDLNCSKLRTLDLGITPNLETLTLQECGNLIELHMPVVCLRLRFVHLSNLRVKTFHLGLAPNLETLTLDGHGSSVDLYMPVELLKLRSLTLCGSRLTMLDLGLTPNLEKLELRRCYDLVEVQVPIGCLELKHITFLMTNPTNLRTLDLRRALNLETLELVWCRVLVELYMPRKCLNLKSIILSNSNLRTLEIGMTPNLISLTLISCTYLEELHMADECPKLAHLSISHSKLMALDLRLTPNLESLHLKECCNLIDLHAPIICLKKLVCLDFSGCLGFRSFLCHINDNTSCRVDESHEVGSFANLRFTLERCPFHSENNFPKFEFTFFYKEDLPPLTTSLEKLISKGPCACTKLETFSRSICYLKR